MAGICWVSGYRSFEAIFAAEELIERTHREGSWIELRLDRCADRSLERLRVALRKFDPRKVVVTFRSSEEGGCAGAVLDEERLEYWRVAQEEGAAYVDIELQSLLHCSGVRESWEEADSGSKLIVSVHDFMGSPSLEEFRELRRRAEAAGADLFKVAVSPKSIEASLPLLDLVLDHDFRRPILGVVMGDGGLWSRVLAPAFPRPPPFTFARGEQLGTAPGQPLGSELESVYRFRSVSSSTRIWGMVGEPADLMDRLTRYNAALERLRVDGVFVPFKFERDSLDTIRHFATKLNLAGLTVSAPFQQKMLSSSRGPNATAPRSEKVDTIAIEQGNAGPDWIGYDTMDATDAQFRILTGLTLDGNP